MSDTGFPAHKNSDIVQSFSAHQTQNTISPQGGNTGIARNPKKNQSKTVNWLHPFFGKSKPLVGAVSC